jgi:hypothetical protein
MNQVTEGPNADVIRELLSTQIEIADAMVECCKEARPPMPPALVKRFEDVRARCCRRLGIPVER